MVGKNVMNGEQAVWIVEGGRYKASFLLPDSEEMRDGEGEQRLIISEVS